MSRPGVDTLHTTGWRVPTTGAPETKVQVRNFDARHRSG